ncbi:MAG: aminotransferase class V-fold PLP-dependent enzyme [Fimbriimonadales bacterium]|nr:aminotransferase class V-fold PLP-dependent enzyme [Fimbriimonadales bacterium]
MLSIEEQVSKLGNGPLTEHAIHEHIRPLFSRVLQRGEIYLANHSLGRPLDQTENDILEALSLWYAKMDGAWGSGGWLDEMYAFRERVAKLIDLADSTCVIPKTSAGQGLRAVLNSFPVDRPIRVVATRGEFDSIDFILKVYALKGRAKVTWVEPLMTDPVRLFDSESIISAITHGTDLVVISQVVFATGQVIPKLDEMVHAAHGSGALVLVDAYHSAGVIPTRMNCDFMIGGSYKYARGGPGACWLAIDPRHIDEKRRSLDTGWFAKQNQFAFMREDDPKFAESGDSWLESTPPVITYYQARAGMRLLLAIGVERLREYSLQQLQYLRSCFRESGVSCFEPKSPNDFGAFALVPHNDANALAQKLKAEGVNTDSRGNFVRFGPDILNTNEELREAARITAQLI